jgi:hypothetical protein
MDGLSQASVQINDRIAGTWQSSLSRKAKSVRILRWSVAGQLFL